MDKKEKKKQDSIYKVIIIGDPSVGKEELLAKFTTQKFNEKYVSTVGVSILKESIELKEFNVTVDLELWNIAGQPQFNMLHRPYFNGADGILLVFDITYSDTFKNINNWYSSAMNYGLKEVPIILIGNKAHLDNERKIILPLAENLCEKLNIYYYYETSHLTGYNVKEAFEKIAELIYTTKILNQPIKYKKITTKPYQGEIIEIPEKIQHRKKKKIDSLVDPDLLWYLDQFGKLPPESYIPQTFANRASEKKRRKKN